MDQEEYLIKNPNVRIAVTITLYAIFIGLTIAVVYVVGARMFDIGNSIFNEQAIDQKNAGVEKVIKLDSDNMSDAEIAHILVANRLTRDEFITKLQIKMSGFGGKFKAGTYTLSTEMKPSDMFKLLAAGKGEGEK